MSMKGSNERKTMNPAHTESFLFLRIIFTGLFVGVLIAGAYLVKNHERFFGVDPGMPSENESSRGYSRLQVFVIWAHVAALTGAFALLLH
jgi:hypothetical protein